MTTESPPKNSHDTSPTHEPPAAVRAAGIVVVLTVPIDAVGPQAPASGLAFALPAARSKPHSRSRGSGQTA